MERAKMKKIFVCSRYTGDEENNLNFARKVCKEIAFNGDVPLAPHLIYPQFLDNNDLDERRIGIDCGKAFLDVCDELWICHSDPCGQISEGMYEEIRHAQSKRTPVVIKYYKF
jgi:hypothetical protein